MSSEYEVIIVGGGPAGLTAGLQMQRMGIDVVLIEKNDPGGLLYHANLVENYPGFPDGIRGPRLAKKIKYQAERLGLRVMNDEVTETIYNGKTFEVRSGKGFLSSRRLVIASGTYPKEMTGFEIPENCRAKVSYGVTDFLDDEGKTFIIVGSGDAAFDYALNLGGRNEVIILNRSDRLKCLSLLKKRTGYIAEISYFENTRIISLALNEDKLNVTTEREGKEIKIVADHLIGAIGRNPEILFIGKSILRQKEELEKRNLLFYIGDVKNGDHRQSAIACGDGMRAAMIISDEIKKQNSPA